MVCGKKYWLVGIIGMLSLEDDLPSFSAGVAVLNVVESVQKARGKFGAVIHRWNFQDTIAVGDTVHCFRVTLESVTCGDTENINFNALVI